VPGSDISVVVLDNDANLDPTKIEFLEVDFSSMKFEEPNERLKLFEDDVNSGRFVGSLKTLASSVDDPITTISQDGYMAVDPGDVITVTYVDFLTFAGVQGTILSHLTAATAGTLTACPVNGSHDCLHWSYVDQGITVYMALPGESFEINVTDTDLALEADVANVSAFVFPSGTADYERIDLTLRGDSTFSGILKSEVGMTGTPMDGVLTLSDDSEVTFTYIDEVPRVTKKAIIRMASKGVLEVGPRLFNGFPALAVNLTDRDLNTKQDQREVVTVEVVNQRFPDQIVRISLLESAPASGFFLGSITLTYASTSESVNDGTLRGLSGDRVSVSYKDMLPAALIKTTMPLRFAGGLRVSSYDVAGNEVVSVTLTDGDLDPDKTKTDTINAIVSLVSDVDGPFLISMTETAVDTSIFTASILPRLTGTSINIDAIDPFGLARQVQVAKGNHFSLIYVDANNGIPIIQTVNVFTKATIGVSVIFSGNEGALQVTMTDADMIGVSQALFAEVYTSDSTQAVETVQLTATSVGSAVFTGNVLAQAHTGATKLGVVSLRDTDSIFARYYDTQPLVAIATQVMSPRPRFIEPTPLDLAQFHTAVDCAFQIGLRGADRSLASKRLIGAAVLIRPTRYREKDGIFRGGLVPGVSLSHAEAGSDFETAMSWTPRRDQEGRVFTMCFAVQESHGLVSTLGGSSERCFELTVVRCRKCARPGESLNHIALLLGSEWLTVWSFNPQIKMPQELLDGALVNTSLAYKVFVGDSLATISMRFGTTVKYLLAINAHLTAGGTLMEDDIICVLPNQIALDGCPAQARSTTFEKLEEQYVPVDYFDNPFNWEDIQWTDLGGKPVKTQNPDYPQIPARKVGKQPGYSLPPSVLV